jgi:hypothetical protein
VESETAIEFLAEGKFFTGSHCPLISKVTIMEITASAVAVYATLALLSVLSPVSVVALLHHRRVRTQGKPALARSLTWSGVGFMLFSSCGFVAELSAFGRIATGYYIVITPCSFWASGCFSRLAS